MQFKSFKRDHDREGDSEPYHWINREWGAGQRSRIRVWIERDVSGYDMEKWTVRKEEFDDSNRGQHKPTNLSGHSSKESARKAAVGWMRGQEEEDEGGRR
jgi:hypothetical protein